MNGLTKNLSAMCASIIIIGITNNFAFAGQTREDAKKRLDRAAEVLNEIMKAPDKGIPREVIDRAKCIAVFPSLTKVAIGVGGEHGRGVATCRTNAGWSAPAFLAITGGSYGLQIGGEATDLVLVAMNEKGMRDLLSSKFKIGGDAAVAAGPVGRHAEADTDIAFKSEILTYSRARGVFAGISLKGAEVRQDEDSTIAFYGKKISYEDLLAGRVKPPAAARTFLATVQAIQTETAAAKQR